MSNNVTFKSFNSLIDSVSLSENIVFPELGGRRFCGDGKSFSYNELLTKLSCLIPVNFIEKDEGKKLLGRLIALDERAKNHLQGQSLLKRMLTAVRSFFGNLTFDRKGTIEKLNAKFTLSPQEESHKNILGDFLAKSLERKRNPKITMGQGEYIIFHKTQNGERKELSRELFDRVYSILNVSAPAAIINSGSDTVKEECAERYERIKAGIRKIDGSLEIAFVPRTLCELIFIRQTIEEDFKHENIPDFNARRFEELSAKPLDENIQERLNECKNREMRQCWHLCYFKNAGDNNHQGVRNVAYRLNEVMVKTLSPTSKGFTLQELAGYADNEINYLQKLREDDTKINASYRNMLFGCERHSMNLGIRDDADAQVVKKAIMLECSKIAKSAFLLYRGAEFKSDSVIHYTDEPFSLSFGTSLFAGCMYDPAATAFAYMRMKDNDAFAIAVPFDQLNDSPFYVPPTNTIAQLFCDGDTFHARTKCWNGYALRKLGGGRWIRGVQGTPIAELYTNLRLSKDEHIAKFEEYKSKVIMLKSGK